MLHLSIKALAVGVALAFVLALVANLLEPPIWTVYIAFVAIIALTAAIHTAQERAHRGAPRKHRHTSAP